MYSVTTVPEEFAMSVFHVVIIPSMPTLMHCKDLQFFTYYCLSDHIYP